MKRRIMRWMFDRVARYFVFVVTATLRDDAEGSPEEYILTRVPLDFLGLLQELRGEDKARPLWKSDRRTVGKVRVWILPAKEARQWA